MSKSTTIIVSAGIAMIAIAYACAQQSGSEQQVRNFMTSVFEYEDTGNVEKMIDCYDTEHVLFVRGMSPESSMLGLSQGGAGYISDPCQWTVAIDDKDALRTYCEGYAECHPREGSAVGHLLRGQRDSHNTSQIRCPGQREAHHHP